MTLHFASQLHDGPDVVISARPGYHYQITDLTSVDSQINWLRDQVEHNEGLAQLVKAQYRRDIDQLLERRGYLMLFGAIGDVA
jgi:hypothetical protein